MGWRKLNFCHAELVEARLNEHALRQAQGDLNFSLSFLGKLSIIKL
jgi:hypothetical protein